MASVSRSSPEWPSAASRVVGTIGYPVAQSMSPLLHQAAFDALGLDWVSVGFEVLPGETAAALNGARSLGIAGLSVTMPHKTEAAKQMDMLTPLAQRLESINCVIPRHGRLVGDSTDGAGMLEALRRDAGVHPAGMRCAVIGAGGAARAAVAALADAKAAEVVVVNRTESRAYDAAKLAGAVGRVAGPEALTGAELIVHATPLGMVGREEESSLGDLSGYFHEGQVVMDLVYVPQRTGILIAAEEQGATAVGGIGMLIHQAAISLEHWTERVAPLDAMWAAALNKLAQ
ncbi:MAG: shikimate dehydrogenase [Acidimicrobiales bacterium]